MPGWFWTLSCVELAASHWGASGILAPPPQAETGAETTPLQQTTTGTVSMEIASHNPQYGKISDQDQQVWVLQGETLVTLPRSGNVASVTITVIPCKYPESLEKGKGDPIYLGIKDPDMCLFCEDSEGQPTLRLKEGKILDLYNQAEPVRPFLFYHSRVGRTSTFESVAFPGWFIASSTRGQPIFLTSEQGKSNNTNFNLDLDVLAMHGGGWFGQRSLS